MHQPQRRHRQRIAQIVIEPADLRRQQQPLVDDGAAGEAGHVKFGQAGQIVLDRQRRQRILRLLADRQNLALERILIGAIGSARDKALTDHRHLLDHRLAKAVHGGRHIAPADQLLAFLGDEFFEIGHRKIARRRFLRQKAHRDGIIARLRQVVARLFRPIGEQIMRQLDQDTRAVAQQRVRPHRSAVIEVFQNLQRLGNDRVAFNPLDMGNKAHTAAVMLVALIVETLGRWKTH